MLSRDLTSPRWIIAKGLLFVLLGLLATGALAIHLFGGGLPGPYAAWQALGLHALAIWAFCRAYYFAFYVIEKYVDPEFRFAGIGSAARWLVSGRLRVDRTFASSTIEKFKAK